MCDKLSAELEEVLGENGVLLYPSHSTPAPYHGMGKHHTESTDFSQMSPDYV